MEGGKGKGGRLRDFYNRVKRVLLVCLLLRLSFNRFEGFLFCFVLLFFFPPTESTRRILEKKMQYVGAPAASNRWFFYTTYRIEP